MRVSQNIYINIYHICHLYSYTYIYLYIHICRWYVLPLCVRFARFLTPTATTICFTFVRSEKSGGSPVVWSSMTPWFTDLWIGLMDFDPKHEQIVVWLAQFLIQIKLSYKNIYDLGMAPSNSNHMGACSFKWRSLLNLHCFIVGGSHTQVILTVKL